MKRTIGVLVLICTIMISLALNGSAEMIINVSSIIIVFGTYLAGMLLSNIKLDDILEEIDKPEANVNIVGRFREIIKMASLSAIMISFSINGLNLIFNYSNNESFGKPIQGILVTLLYVVVIQSIISFIFYT